MRCSILSRRTRLKQVSRVFAEDLAHTGVIHIGHDGAAKLTPGSCSGVCCIS